MAMAVAGWSWRSRGRLLGSVDERGRLVYRYKRPYRMGEASIGSKVFLQRLLLYDGKRKSLGTMEGRIPI